MSAAYVKLIDHFREHDLRFSTQDEQQTVTADFRGEVGTFRIVAHVDEHDSLFQVFGYMPIRIPEGARPEVALAITRANFGLKIGKFEMDLEDGEVLFQASQVLFGVEADASGQNASGQNASGHDAGRDTDRNAAQDANHDNELDGEFDGELDRELDSPFDSGLFLDQGDESFTSSDVDSEVEANDEAKVPLSDILIVRLISLALAMLDKYVPAYLSIVYANDTARNAIARVESNAS